MSKLTAEQFKKLKELLSTAKQSTAEEFEELNRATDGVYGKYFNQDMGDFNVIVDKADEKYIKGLVLDYNDSLLNSGFQFSNPNAKETCGCGSSFSI